MHKQAASGFNPTGVNKMDMDKAHRGPALTHVDI